MDVKKPFRITDWRILYQRIFNAAFILIACFNPQTAIVQEEAHHHHGQIDAALFQFTPKIEIDVTKDAVSGWNLYIVTEHFRFAPENVNTATIPGEGHAHLYINGVKTARLYSHWYHIAKQAPGKHTISVTLNTNDHSEIALNGQSIKAVAEIEELE